MTDIEPALVPDLKQRLTRQLFYLELWLTARLLPLLIIGRNLESTLEFADGNGRAPYRNIAPGTIASAALRVTRRPWLMRNRRCFRQGLLGYRFLKKAGYEPALHFGIAPGSLDAPLVDAHCWVVLDDQPLISDIMDDMVEIHVHGAANAKAR